MHPLIDIAHELSGKLSHLSFGSPVTHVYNPHTYAIHPYIEYITRYACSPCEVVLFGMNPGPFGMTQTGIPFGEVTSVRDWLGIQGNVGQPPRPHARRPIEGFSCRRSEVSGARLWGWAKEHFVTPQSFFSRFLVLNYCPLVFMEASGKNRTPDKLAKNERNALFAACDEALVATVDFARPRYVVGVGAFAAGRIKSCLDDDDFILGQAPHPSPASPLANRGYGAALSAALAKIGISLPTPIPNRANGGVTTHAYLASG